MDVPFHSSNALSRAQYAIVRKVESTTSPQSADQELFLEIKSIEGQLCHPKLSSKKCKECLVILLYCATAVTTGFLSNDAFDYAFPHAINLAEMGTTIEEKRIGYLFCAEMMPLDHDLRLMLINTLRKDLESDDIPRICLALDNLISSPTEDVIPAVQSRLHDLLVDNHAQVRRRALLAFYELSKYNDALIVRIQTSIVKCLQDSDSSVVHAALIIARTLSGSTAIVTQVNELLVAESAYIGHSEQDILLSVLKTFKTLTLSQANISILFDILEDHSVHDRPTSPHSKSIIFEIFLLFSQVDHASFLSIEKLRKTSVIQCIRQLLVSNHPNDVHLFVSCLKCIPVSSWAGTNPDIPAALDSFEFERIMQLLSSPDQALRTKMLRVIKEVDSSILDGHVDALLGSASAHTSEVEMHLLRIVEVRLIQYEEDGSEYARQILDMLRKVYTLVQPPQVFKGVIEAFLLYIRTPKSPDFVSSCATHIVTVLSEPEVHLDPTALVIATALATEFSASVSTSPLQILSGLGERVRVCPAIVQEPCVIAMLRVRADCEDVPPGAIDAIKFLSQTARRSIRSFCTEVLDFFEDKDKRDVLLGIVQDAESPSLPDFLAALQRYKRSTSKASSTPPPQISRASSRTSQHVSHGASLLRYEAYATPEVVPSSRTRRASSSQHSSVDSPASRLLPASTLSPSLIHQQVAARLGELSLSSANELPKRSRGVSQYHDIVERADLISLESPFEVDLQRPLDASENMEREHNFEGTWNELHSACDLRGWCNTPIDTVTRKLQRVEGHHLRVIPSDVPPFIGELKILMIPNETTGQGKPSSLVAFRLQEADDDTCLWRLRCVNDGVGVRMERVLNT